MNEILFWICIGSYFFVGAIFSIGHNVPEFVRNLIPFTAIVVRLIWGMHHG